MDDEIDVLLERAVQDINAGRWRQADHFARLMANAALLIRKQSAEIEQLRSTAAYLVAEVENDWDKGRISVDTYHAALHCKKDLPQTTKDKSLTDRLKERGYQPIANPCPRCGKNILPDQIICLQCQLDGESQ